MAVGEWEDFQFSYGKLDFKILVGLLILDGLQVLGYMSLQLKAKVRRRDIEEGAAWEW